MVLLAKLKNPLKTKADAMVESEHEEGCYERFGLEEVTMNSEDEVGTGTCAEEEAQQVELPPEENDEPVEEMDEVLNKFPPDNCANEPTAVESCSRVTANMGVTLKDALEDGVMVANGDLAKQLDSTKVKKVPDEPPVHDSLFLLLYDYGAENQQQRNMAKDNVCNVELDVIKNNPANDGICVQVDDEAEFTKDI